MDFHTFQPTVTIDKSCNYYGESSTALAMVAKINVKNSLAN